METLEDLQEELNYKIKFQVITVEDLRNQITVLTEKSMFNSSTLHDLGRRYDIALVELETLNKVLELIESK